MANFSNKPRPRYITVTPKGEFKSLALAAKAESLTPMAIVKRLDNQKNAKYYRKYPNNIIDMGSKSSRNYDLDKTTLVGTVVATPEGDFKTAKAAAEHFGVSPCTITCRIKNNNFPGFYRKKEGSVEEKKAKAKG